MLLLFMGFAKFSACNNLVGIIILCQPHLHHQIVKNILLINSLTNLIPIITK